MSERLAYSVVELQQVLGIGRATALRLANEIGIRVSPRRILVPRVRLEAYLAGEEGVNTVGNGTGKEKAPNLTAVESRA